MGVTGLLKKGYYLLAAVGGIWAVALGCATVEWVQRQ